MILLGQNKEISRTQINYKTAVFDGYRAKRETFMDQAGGAFVKWLAQVKINGKWHYLTDKTTLSQNVEGKTVKEARQKAKERLEQMLADQEEERNRVHEGN